MAARVSTHARQRLEGESTLTFAYPEGSCQPILILQASWVVHAIECYSRMLPHARLHSPESHARRSDPESDDEGLRNRRSDVEEEELLAEAHDNRFVHLRAQLSAALLRLQRELSQSRCEVCSHQLRYPFRMIGCRHLVCGLCAESTVRYWDECPVCGNTGSPARHDPLHAVVLQHREDDYWSACTDTTPMAGREGIRQDSTWLSRLDIAVKVRGGDRRRQCDQQPIP